MAAADTIGFRFEPRGRGWARARLFLLNTLLGVLTVGGLPVDPLPITVLVIERKPGGEELARGPVSRHHAPALRDALRSDLKWMSEEAFRRRWCATPSTWDEQIGIWAPRRR